MKFVLAAWLTMLGGLLVTPLAAMDLSAQVSEDPCQELHQSFRALAPDGGEYPTWHPPSAQLPDGTACHFGHEHGSDPSRFIGAPQARAVTFGWVDELAGHPEPHEGFKVFVVSDDTQGLAYRVVLHQGTGHGRRALSQHHEVQFAVADAATGELLADTAALADFGAGRANCRPEVPLPDSFMNGEHDQHTAARRTVPTVDCAAETPYETWRMDYQVGAPDTDGRRPFSTSATFDVDNPATVFDPADPSRLVYLCEVRESHHCAEPSGEQTAWKGTQRGLVAPGIVLWNNGPDSFTTDVYGAPGDALPQFVSADARLDFSGECCGPSVVFKERDGLYVAQSLGGPAFSAGTDDGSVHWPN
jgi:hypothetical protein